MRQPAHEKLYCLIQINSSAASTLVLGKHYLEFDRFCTPNGGLQFALNNGYY